MNLTNLEQRLTRRYPVTMGIVGLALLMAFIAVVWAAVLCVGMS